MSALGVVIRKVRAALELSPAAHVSLIPVVIAEDLTEPQNNSQFDERISAGLANQTPDAVEVANIQLFNPANSGVLLVVREIWAGVTVADVIFLSRLDTPLAGAPVTTIGFRDTRLAGLPAGELRGESNVAQLGSPRILNILGDTNISHRIPLTLILAPGTGFNLFSGVDIVMRSSWVWTEQALPNV